MKNKTIEKHKNNLNQIYDLSYELISWILKNMYWDDETDRIVPKLVDAIEKIPVIKRKIKR